MTQLLPSPKHLLAALLATAACNPAPPEPEQGVLYRDGLEDGEPNSGERGSIVITELMWSGSVDNNGNWDAEDVFIELSNNSARSVNVSGWQLQIEGTAVRTYLVPQSDLEIPVGGYLFLAAKSSGCFPEPDLILEGLRFSFGDPLRVTLKDKDERLMEPAGSRTARPFAGGYDQFVSRSMEKAELMFGARGYQPKAWHYYTDTEVDVPNNDRIAENCRERTLASPGRPNSPDYSGSFSSGEAF